LFSSKSITRDTSSFPMAMHLASLVHGSAQEWDVKAATQPLTTMSESQPGSKSHQHESDGASESERAYRVWNHKFGARQLSLGRDDAAPFTIGRYLGGGGIGVVHEIRLETIPLAIKRTYTRKLTIDQLNEIKILSRLSEQRHHHVVQLVGSYIHQQRAGYELGLLIWPVAHCDLSVLLNDLGTLAEWLNRVATMDILDHNIEDIASPLELLSQLAELEISQDLIASQGLWLYTNELVLRVKHRLLQSFGCIAKAVAHIHHHGIRHKDLKPSQILLSPTGLWLTDFGWSADRSEFNQSATSGGDQMTIKYQAPERASMQSCGRPEDVFATGCIFLEIFSYTSTRATSQASVRPWLQKGWFFHANLGQIYDILDNPMETSSADYEGVFNRLLRQMLAKSPRKRPTIRAVLNMLKEPPYQYQLGPYLVNSHFGHCCQRKLKMNRASKYLPKKKNWVRSHADSG
jgi:serine/threonine protein kinase